jgi:hypothetical protein
MTLSRLCGLSLLAALVLACSSDGVIGPSSRFDHAAATFACGPADGPALAIYLSENPMTVGDPPGAFVRVYVPGSVDDIVGKMWPIGGNSEAAAWFQSGANVYQPDASNFEIATGGYLLVSSGSAGQTLDGSVDIQFPKAGHLQRAFRAEWIQSTVLCG